MDAVPNQSTADHDRIDAFKFNALLLDISVNLVAAIQSEHAIPPTKQGKRPRNEKDEGRDEDSEENWRLRHELESIKIDP